MTRGVELIAAERKRQIKVEGYTEEHDRKFCKDELARAAACYALPENRRGRIVVPKHDFPSEENRFNTQGGQIIIPVVGVPKEWPWLGEAWKPTPDDRIRELTKAGALILAELNRLLASKDGDHD